MKKLSLILLLTQLIFVNCESADEGHVNLEERIFNGTLTNEDGDTRDLSIDSFTYATIYNGSSLSITCSGDNFLLLLDARENFENNSLKVGRYKIGTPQDHIVNNIFYDGNDDLNSPSIFTTNSYYTSIYGCDVLSNELQGEINITTLDKENKIIAGTFNGVLFRWVGERGDFKTIKVANGLFKLPYTERETEVNEDHIVTAKVNGYTFNADKPSSYFEKSSRQIINGVDKIKILGNNDLFGVIRISIPSGAVPGSSFMFRPTGRLSSLGISFFNNIHYPNNFNFNIPNRSNDSYINIIYHDKDKNIIEGEYYIENSEIPNLSITNGYFKAEYKDLVDD
ncbi:hypothetical protein MHTCC0001_16090 [Flavobacteriaceae bacterium MHTCC 0001]